MRTLSLILHDDDAARIERLAAKHNLTTAQVAARAALVVEEFERLQAQGGELLRFPANGTPEKITFTFGRTRP